MIFVLAGTQDGREIVRLLLEQGHDVAASVVSSYGGELLAHACGQRCLINDKPLDEAALKDYLQEHDIRLLVDASHPYAANVSRNAIAVCQALSIPYIRYERDLSKLDYDRITVVHSYEEAAQAAASLGSKIFLTTGSRNLQAPNQLLLTPNFCIFIAGRNYWKINTVCFFTSRRHRTGLRDLAA